MQNQYVGNIGDYIKYALLHNMIKAEPKKKLGVAWYFRPNGDGAKGRQYFEYLKNPRRWEELDPDLFKHLRDIVCRHKQRDVRAIERLPFFRNVAFHNEPLEYDHKNKEAFRKNWFQSMQKQLTGCEIIFADPDIGLRDDNKHQWGQGRFWKYLPLCEIHALCEGGRAGIFYHHNNREKGTNHAMQIEEWQRRIGAACRAKVVALYWRAYSCRTFFIVNPTGPMMRALQALKDRGLRRSGDGKPAICLYLS